MSREEMKEEMKEEIYCTSMSPNHQINQYSYQVLKKWSQVLDITIYFHFSCCIYVHESSEMTIIKIIMIMNMSPCKLCLLF